MKWCNNKECEYYEDLEDNHCSVTATIDRCVEAMPFIMQDWVKHTLISKEDDKEIEGMELNLEGKKSSVEGRVIFEAVDRTDEDMYFTVGLWPTLEEAIKAFDNSTDPDEFSNDVCHEEYCLIEIRERKIGWSDTGIERAKLEWTSEYDEENNEYIWARKI